MQIYLLMLACSACALQEVQQFTACGVAFLLLLCCGRYLFVDEVNRLLLVSIADKSAYLYDLAAGAVPLAR
jgi:hypothetical protein